MELFFDFTEYATRGQILATVLDAMTQDQRKRYDEFAEDVTIPDHHHNTMAEIQETINALAVPQQIKMDSLGVYQVLTQAEAKVHNTTVEHTHFHEVGNSAGIRNVLAICVGMFVLEPTVVKATSVQVGKGKVQCAHGLMDIPTPATKAIIETGIPVCKTRLEGERCTPTSAALIKHFVQEFV